jgi:hypothetical protein
MAAARDFKFSYGARADLGQCRIREALECVWKETGSADRQKVWTTNQSLDLGIATSSARSYLQQLIFGISIRPPGGQSRGQIR